MRRTTAVLTLAVAATMAGSSTEAARFGPAVREARAWARERLNPGQWRALDRLIRAESGWAIHARNPRSGAYGLSQALPGHKMAAAERPRWGRRWDSWRHDWRVQLTWTIRRVRAVYGTMKKARAFQRLRGYW